MRLLLFFVLMVSCVISGGNILHIPISLHTSSFEESFDLTIDTEYDTQYQVNQFCNEYVIVTSMCDQLMDLVRSNMKRNNLEENSLLPPTTSVSYDTIREWKTVYDPKKCIEMHVLSFCASRELSKRICQQLYQIASKHVSTNSCLLTTHLGVITAPIPQVHTEVLNIWSYWDGGYEAMPSILQQLHRHNLHIVSACRHNFFLLSATSASRFIKLPAHFMSLPPVAQADYVRIHVLYAFGGLWIDTDYILYDNPLQLVNIMYEANATILVAEEKGYSIGNSLILSYSNTSILRRVISDMNNEIDNFLLRRRNGYSYIIRDFLGPRLLAKSIQDAVSDGRATDFAILAADSIGHTINRVVWYSDPVYNNSMWLMPTEFAAIREARRILESKLAVIGLWTLAGGCAFMHDIIMNDARSIFYQIIRLSRAIF